MPKRPQLGYSLRKQPTEGSWLVIVSAGVGRQVRQVVHAPTETKAHREAQRVLGPMREEADRLRENARRAKLSDQPGVMTLDRLTDHWLRERGVEGLTPTTLNQYRALAAWWRNTTIGKTAVVDLTADAVNAWRAKLETKAGKPLRASTQRQIIGDLHNCLAWGHRSYDLPTPVTERVTLPRHRTERRAVAQVDRYVEAVEYLEAIGSDVAGMALVALGAGLRAGEVCGLRWEDVGTKLRVAGAAKRDGTWGETKGRRERLVPISGICRAGIDIAEERSDDSSPWLWPRPADPSEFRRPDWLSKQWAKLAPKVGLDGTTFHGLRHAAGSALLREGLTFTVVAQILGHSTPRVTMEVYAHVLGELGVDALAPLDRAFRRS